MSLIRTETHQHFVLQRLAKSDPEGAKGLQEWDAVNSTPPVFSAPWVPLRWVWCKREGGKPWTGSGLERHLCLFADMV